VTAKVGIPLLVAVAAAVLGLALVHAAPASSPKPRQQPTLLWRTFPLDQRPTRHDEVTITRALRLIDESPTASAQADARSPEVILVLLAAALMLGLAALPQTVLQDVAVTAFAERWRRELLLVGGALLLAGVALMFG
jgi:hypothetical protein